MKLRASMLYVAFFLTGPAIAVAADNAPLLPAPENAVMEPLSSHLKVNGVDMRAVQFHVGAEEERLRSYFVEACAKLGGSYTENLLRNEHIQSCIIPPYSLTSQWHMEGDSAYGTLTSLRIDQKIERNALPEDLPLPTNAQVLQDVESSDAGIRGRVLHMRVDTPAAILRASLDKALLAQQWQPAPAMRNNGSVISMNKGNRRLDVVIGEDGTGKSRLVIVLDQR
ncbi:hypothetical protein JKG47_06525 [Acidithiobacillus sp. MC6.1]|nr:hypothetical protein [Acidithiobacillus sp. MC6.1]